MATIRKRGGKYQVQIRRKGFGLVSRSFHTRADANEWARFTEAQADRGELPPPIKMLERHKVREIIERYRDEISVKKLSHNTEIYILNAFLRHSMADYSLARISPSDFSAYRERRQAEVKAGTVNRELSIIKHAFDIAMREWDIPLRHNPLGKIKKLKVQNSRNRRLLPEEFEAIEAEATNSRNPHIMRLIRFAIETAMRRGEILRLKWSDIDLKARTLFIPVAKNGHSRTIPLSRQAIAILQELQTAQQRGGDLVFPLSDNAAKLAWQRLIERTNIENLHFHDFRHEAISRFFERGLSVPEVALISGHRDFGMLFRYTHMNPELIAEKLV